MKEVWQLFSSSLLCDGFRRHIQKGTYISLVKVVRLNGAKLVGRCAGFSVVLFLLVSAAIAQVPVTVRVSTASNRYAIPADFAGIGFETASVLPNRYGVSGYFFTPKNTQLVILMRNMGVRNIRVGGGTVDSFTDAGACAASIPTRADVDHLFRFAQQAGVKVIYSLRLLNPRSCPISGLISDDADMGRWIWDRYRANLDSFSIGNEPDWHSYHQQDPAIFETVPGVPGSAFPSYLADWQKFAGAIRRKVPEAQFSGPDTGAYTPATNVPNPSSGVSWTQKFAEDTRHEDVTAVLQHFYVGHGFILRCGIPKRTYTLSSRQAIDDMLSANWIDGREIASELSAPPNTCGPEKTNGLVYTPYPWLYRHNLAPVLTAGVAYRLTESNDFLGGVPGASDTFASALWALDYMHWWAAHGASGVNFHNNPWIFTDTIIPANALRGSHRCGPIPCSNYEITPKGYAIKAFDLGSHGYVEPVKLLFPAGHINLTAYAVGSGRDLYVTIINKTHGAGEARAAAVTIFPEGMGTASGAAMVLTDGHPGDPALNNAMLGGAAITNHSRWLGRWTPLHPDTIGKIVLTVPPSTAEVVAIHAAGQNIGPVESGKDGNPQVFGVGYGGKIEYLRRNPAVSGAATTVHETAWADLPGGVIADGAVSVARNEDGTLEVFVPNADGYIKNIRQNPVNGGWSKWFDLGRSHIRRYLAVAPNADGSLSIAGIGTNGELWVDSESAPGIAWSGWKELSGKKIQPGYAVGRNLDGNLDVFGTDGQGHVWQDAQTNEEAWSGWSKLIGPSLQPRLAIARNLDGRLEVFGIDQSGEIWHIQQTSLGRKWGGWAKIYGKKLRPGFVVDQDSDGRLVLFGVSRDAPHHVWALNDQSAQGMKCRRAWIDIGGAAMDPQLVVTNTLNGRIQLFGVGPDGDVWSDWQSANGNGWNGWTNLGGKGIRFYPEQQ